jgi:hypothetical protein
MQTKTTEAADLAPRIINSTDMTIGQPIVARLQARQQELSTLLVAVPDKNGHLHSEITLALDAVQQLLSGDLANVTPIVLADMNRWLQRNKHVAESAVTPAVLPDPPALMVVADEG